MKINNESVASVNWTNAPDKVYLSSCMRPDFIKAVTNGHAGDIEYIRKDALLEWLMNCSNNPVISDLQKVNIQELIEKLKSM